MHVTALLHPYALRGESPGGLRQRGRVVQVVLRERLLDGVRRLQCVVVRDRAVHLLKLWRGGRNVIKNDRVRGGDRDEGHGWRRRGGCKRINFQNPKRTSTTTTVAGDRVTTTTPPPMAPATIVLTNTTTTTPPKPTPPQTATTPVKNSTKKKKKKKNF